MKKAPAREPFSVRYLILIRQYLDLVIRYLRNYVNNGKNRRLSSERCIEVLPQ